jgi:hypothetical protein
MEQLNAYWFEVQCIACRDEEQKETVQEIAVFREGLSAD